MRRTRFAVGLLVLASLMIGRGEVYISQPTLLG
jgi:hypothetical protein